MSPLACTINAGTWFATRTARPFGVAGQNAHGVIVRAIGRAPGARRIQRLATGVLRTLLAVMPGEALPVELGQACVDRCRLDSRGGHDAAAQAQAQVDGESRDGPSGPVHDVSPRNVCGSHEGRYASRRRSRQAASPITIAVLKDRVAQVSDFLDALRRVAAGGTALDPEVIAQLLVRRRDNPLDRLTPREQEVLRLMAEGRSNHGITEALQVSRSAVEKYVSNIFTKLDLPPTDIDHRRVLAVLKYLAS